MEKLNALDITVILGYFAILIGIGLYLRKRASASLDDYFLGGKKLPWWALGISGMAAWLDLTGTMLIVSFLFLLGPRGLFIEFRGGAGLVLVFMMIYVGKWHRRSGLMTSAEWMAFRFGTGFWGKFARIAQVFAMIIFATGMLAYSIKGVGLFLSMFLPFKPSTCAAIMMVITTVYLIQSGFYGVVVTDVFQSVCILIGVVFIVVFAAMKVTGTDLSAVAEQVTGNPIWTTTVPAWNTSMPKGYEQYSSLTLVSMFFLFKSIIIGSGIYVDGRYFGASGERECGLLGFTSGWSIMMRWPLMMGFAILGIYLVRELFPDQAVLGQAAEVIRDYFTNTVGIEGGLSANLWHERLADVANHPEKYAPLVDRLEPLLGNHWQEKLNLVSFEGTVYPERILPAVLLFTIPMGVRGLLMVALMAAAMSTFNTFINTTTSFFTRDLYQAYIRPNAKNAELIYISWGFGVVLVIAGFAMAFFAPDINNIWGWLMGGLSAGMVVPWVLRFYWWRFNGGGFAVGTVAGVIIAVLQRILFPQMQEWNQFLFILGAGVLACVISTFITKPTDRKTLEIFYRKTRPFGLWSDFPDILDEQTRKEMKKEHLNDLIAIPFGYGWLVTLLMLPMQMMVGAWKSFAVTFVIFLASLAGLFYFWYRNLPPMGTVKTADQQ